MLIDTANRLAPEQHLSITKQVYFGLREDNPEQAVLDQARSYLHEQLQAVSRQDSDLPHDVNALPSWIENNVARVGEQYRQYLHSRKAGGPKQYFTSKAHALYFLKSAAPTKMVDGAWLYGLVHHWNDDRFTALIHIYLEELGEGIPDKNHVAIYKRLLDAYGCTQWHALSDAHYTQGAIQLALSRHADIFLPELIGFNLGYEQLPLHLLITAYELNELGIDPYYFTLHITVDNAASGHAQKALQALYESLPRAADKDAFYRRVINGYQLNAIGLGTNAMITSFDLRQELLSIFAQKSTIGAQMHSNYCRIGGKSVNEWLSDPQQLPVFLDSLEQIGWIKRNQDPEHSRFWKLVQGDHAAMFGVFSAYERQVIHDWIAGDNTTEHKPRHLTYKAKQQMLGSLAQSSRSTLHSHSVRGLFREHFSHAAQAQANQNDFNMELRHLEQQLADAPSKEVAMAMLADLMSPAHHHTAAGLMATRIYTRLFCSSSI